MNVVSQTTVEPDLVKSRGRAPPRGPDEPTTLVEVFERVARVHPKPNTLNYKQDGAWRSISSDEMLARMRLIALGLYSLGVRQGDRVAILSESRAEWTLADAGCQFAGAIDVPIYPTLDAATGALHPRGFRRARFVSSTTTKKLVRKLEEVLKDCRAIRAGRAV